MTIYIFVKILKITIEHFNSYAWSFLLTFGTNQINHFIESAGFPHLMHLFEATSLFRHHCLHLQRRVKSFSNKSSSRVYKANNRVEVETFLRAIQPDLDPEGQPDQ